jgi:hypothetical protein
MREEKHIEETSDMIPDSAANDPFNNLERSKPHDNHELMGNGPTVSMPSKLVLNNMSVPALAEHCIKEFDKYRNGEFSNGQYALELFNRALMQDDALAWEAVQQCFNTMMHRWMSRHPLKEVAYRLDSEENYIAQGFTRFWQATVHNPDIAFNTLGAAINYLRASLHGVIIDTLRTYSRERVVRLPEPGEAGEPLVEDSYDSGELWEVISHMLMDKRERRIAYLLYHCGLKPREIVRFCYKEFEDVREIYRVRRMIFDRLRRNADYFRARLDNEFF